MRLEANDSPDIGLTTHSDVKSALLVTGPGPISQGSLDRVLRDLRDQAEPGESLALLMFREDADDVIGSTTRALWQGTVVELDAFLSLFDVGWKHRRSARKTSP